MSHRRKALFMAFLGLALGALALALHQERRIPGEALFPARIEGLFGSHFDWGYINAEGSVRIKPQYFFALKFSDGVAFAQTDSITMGHFGPGLAWGLIDEKGAWVLPPIIDEIPSAIIGDDAKFSEGFCPWPQGDHWGYLDKSGDFKIPPAFDHCEPFSDSLAAVEKAGHWHYIDREGKPAFAEGEFEEAHSFAEGTATVRLQGKEGLINTQGAWVIKPQYEELLRAAPGLYLYRKGDHCGVMKEDGTLLYEIPNDLHWGDCSDGMLVVQKDGHWGALNLEHGGALTVSATWDSLDAFSEGLAAFDKDGKSGYINKEGRVVINLGSLYETHDPFTHGLANVCKNNSHEGYLKKDGTWAFRRQLHL